MSEKESVRHGRMSAFQRAQMYSLQDENIYNIAVRGMFDDAQDVKVVFKKFNITEEQFRRSYKYYESHPAWMNRIYDGVMTDLSKKEAEESKQ